MGLPLQVAPFSLHIVFFGSVVYIKILRRKALISTGHYNLWDLVENTGSHPHFMLHLYDNMMEGRVTPEKMKLKILQKAKGGCMRNRWKNREKTKTTSNNILYSLHKTRENKSIDIIRKATIYCDIY